MVDLGEGSRQIVERQDIIPLEEFRRLAEKAKSPCDKHGDGSCECGMPAGERHADVIAARQAPVAPERPRESTTEDNPRERRPKRSRSKPQDQSRQSGRRRGGRRGRRRNDSRAERPNSDD